MANSNDSKNTPIRNPLEDRNAVIAMITESLKAAGDEGNNAVLKERAEQVMHGSEREIVDYAKSVKETMLLVKELLPDYKFSLDNVQEMGQVGQQAAKRDKMIDALFDKPMTNEARAKLEAKVNKMYEAYDKTSKMQGELGNRLMTKGEALFGAEKIESVEKSADGKNTLMDAAGLRGATDAARAFEARQKTQQRGSASNLPDGVKEMALAALQEKGGTSLPFPTDSGEAKGRQA